MHLQHELASRRWRAERDALLDAQDRERDAREHEAWRTARRASVAKHESAHALVALLRGGDVTEVAIPESADGIGGHCAIANIHAADHLVSLAAGEIADGTAERSWLPASQWREAEVTHDIASALITAARLAGNDFNAGAVLVDEARITAARMVGDLREPIEHLARLLLKQGKLSGAVVKCVAARHGLSRGRASHFKYDATSVRHADGDDRSRLQPLHVGHDGRDGCSREIRRRGHIVSLKTEERGVTLEQDLRLSSIHEASHCAIYFAYGYKIRYARLTAEGGGWMGVRCHNEKELDAFERIVAIVAGEIGEEELLGHTETRETIDRKTAMEIARRINAEMPAAVVDCARRQARRLVLGNADAIRMLAAALVERGSLSGKEIAEMLLQHQRQWRGAA